MPIKKEPPVPFFSELSLEQLTELQGVDPAFDLRTLEGAWPEDEDVDEFLAWVYANR